MPAAAAAAPAVVPTRNNRLHAQAPGWADQINWQYPWSRPWRDIGAPVQAAVTAGTPLWSALRVGGCAPVRFVSHTELTPNTGYERFIRETGCCPVRDTLHDFFNGLCWLKFPQAKLRLNELQYQQIGGAPAGSARGAVRDALTLFDENAALLWAPATLWSALQDKDWSRVFGELRPLWEDAQLLLFGHALLEKLQQPRKAITAHVYRLPEHMDDLPALDKWLANDLCAATLATKPFAHLPMLGVPGWWAANDDQVFYHDLSVFRAPGRLTGEAK